MRNALPQVFKVEEQAKQDADSKMNEWCLENQAQKASMRENQYE
jgi:hypothetical protein